MIWIFPLVLLIIFEAIADIFAKEWSLRQHSFLWVGALVAYCIGNTFWLFALKNGSGLSRGAIIFSLTSEILALLIGLVLYKEHFTHTQILGMVLGIFSLILIFWG
jgi:drug/metabolite transporter (DMT)-like permease